VWRLSDGHTCTLTVVREFSLSGVSQSGICYQEDTIVWTVQDNFSAIEEVLLVHIGVTCCRVSFRLFVMKVRVFSADTNDLGVRVF